MSLLDTLMRIPRHRLHILLYAVVGLLMGACASIGRPNGGAYDYDPPVLVKVSPGTGERNVTKNKVVLEFDENVQVQDVMTKVVVSPAQKLNPQVTANGHKVTVELRDSLLPNTTYTIDFSDAIKDLNEGNVVDGLATDFSTGDTIDSLKVSGMVFEARTLEPAQGMLVGVYSNMSDTALTTLPMERIAKTNQYGQFTIRGLRPGDYRLYAINDINRDYHWDRSEDIAFYDVTISPVAGDSIVTDSLLNAAGQDSIVTRRVTTYKPDDLLLTWFNEGYIPQYIKDYQRPSRHKVVLTMGAASDSLPVLRPVGGTLNGVPHESWTMLHRNERADSLEYFITDSTIIMTDSLQLAVTTFRPDTADVWRWMTDTLRFNYKSPKPVEKKKKKNDDEAADTMPVIDFLTLTLKTGSTQDLYGPILLTTEQPLGRIDPAGLRMEMKRDTVWDTIAPPVIVRVDSLSLKNYRIDYDWQPDTRYRLTIDSAAVSGIYGHWNNTVTHEFKVNAVEDYSALYFAVTGLEPGERAIVEMLKNDSPVDTASVVNGMASFPHIMPGEYYARMFIDRNGNGKWDTGSIADTLQPEDVFYYPKKLALKKNWEVEQTWDIYEIPVDKQKPDAIKKNKPKDNTVRRRNPDGSYVDGPERRDGEYDDEDEEEEFGGSFFGPGYNNGSRNIGSPNSFSNSNMRRR